MRAEADHRRVGLEECGMLQSATLTHRQIERRHDNSLDDFSECLPNVVAFGVDDIAVFKNKVVGVSFDLKIVRQHPRNLLLQDAASGRDSAYRVGTRAGADCPGPKG